MISSPVIQHTEKQLIVLLKQKDGRAFDYLYKNYSGIIYGFINKIVLDAHICEDVLQEVFVKIWIKIDQYNPAKGRLCTWILNIARNAAIDVLRSKGEIMKHKISGDMDPLIISQFSACHNTDTIGIKNMVSKLNADCQVIVEMAYFNGYTMIDISKALQIPEGTVKTRLRKGLMSLRAQYI